MLWRKKMKKLIFMIIAILGIFMFGTTIYAAEEQNAHVIIDNELVNFPQGQPFITSRGIVLIPLFAACDKLGASAKWNTKTKTATIVKAPDTLVINLLKNTSPIIKLNGKVLKTDTAPIIKNNVVYVSLNLLSQGTKCSVDWDGSIRTALIKSPGIAADSSEADNKPSDEVECSSEILKVKSFDDYTITGKLDLPKTADSVPELVIFVPGTGPNTYENHRNIGGVEFNYYDLFAQELVKRNIGFFRYNTRGVDIGDQPPLYDSVNMDEYRKYLPDNQVKDIEVLVTELKKNEKLKDSKIILLGWSEGTIIASMAAERKQVQIDGLMLAGYCNENLMDIIEWQLSGASSIIFYYHYFDKNKDGIISKQEFNADPYGIKQALGNITFEQLDTNVDNKLTQADFKPMLKDKRDMLMNAIEKKDDDWIWNNYFQITSEWILEHAKLEPNKMRMMNVDIPVRIFHGIYDQNVPVQGVYDIYDKYTQAGKKNLKAFIFDKHDHDLNYLEYPLRGVIPDGIERIFKECQNFKN